MAEVDCESSSMLFHNLSHLFIVLLYAFFVPFTKQSLLGCGEAWQKLDKSFFYKARFETPPTGHTAVTLTLICQQHVHNTTVLTRRFASVDFSPNFVCVW